MQKFNSLSPLNNSNSASPILKPQDETFKMPVGRAIRTLKASERKSIAVGTSPMKPVAPRRSMRLSMKVPEPNMPIPAPRYRMTVSVPESNDIPVVPLSFKPTRRSVRLSMKCLSPQTFIHTPAPASRFETGNQDGYVVIKLYTQILKY